MVEGRNQQYWYHRIRPYLGSPEVPTSWEQATELARKGVLFCPSTEVVYGPSGLSDTVSYAMNAFSYLAQHKKFGPAVCTDSSPTTTSPYMIKPESRAPGIPPSKIIFISELGRNPRQRHRPRPSGNPRPRLLCRKCGGYPARLPPQRR